MSNGVLNYTCRYGGKREMKIKENEQLSILESHALIGLGVLVFGLIYAERDLREDFDAIKRQRVEFLQKWLKNPKSNEAVLNKFDKTTIFNIISDAFEMPQFKVSGTEKLTKDDSRVSIAVQYGVDTEDMQAFLIEKNASKVEVDYKCGKLDAKSNLKHEVEESLTKSGKNEPRISVGEEFGVLWALINLEMGWVKISHDSNLNNYYIDIQKESINKKSIDELHYKLSPQTKDEFKFTFESVLKKAN